jgi:hypothetical protein
MIHVPVYLAINTDDAEVARQVAEAVTDNSQQLQNVIMEERIDIESPMEIELPIVYSIRQPPGGELCLLEYERGQASSLVRTFVRFPGRRIPT